MPALLPLLLALLCHNAFGRAPEGVLGRENVGEETGEAPSSEVKQGDLTPWEPRSWSSERRRRSLGGQNQSQGYHQRGQGSPIADFALEAQSAGGEGTSIHASPQAPLPVPSPGSSGAPPSSRHPHITRLEPVFVSSAPVRVPGGGVSALYSPPISGPTTIIPVGSIAAPAPNIIVQPFRDCPRRCEIRNRDGVCEVNVTCLFGHGR